MFGIAIVDSGNYALNLCRILEKQGYVFEVVATPCQIARNGCGYSLKFPVEFMNMVISEAAKNNIIIREIYRAVDQFTKFKYERVY